MSAPDLTGLAAARRYAQWHIGYGRWADLIIDAYLNPARTHETLDEEQK